MGEEVDAGRALDAIVAERVMGLRVRFERGEPCGWRDNEAVMWSPNDYIILRQDGKPDTPG